MEEISTSKKQRKKSDNSNDDSNSEKSNEFKKNDNKKLNDRYPSNDATNLANIPKSPQEVFEETKNNSCCNCSIY